ncbi:MAG: AMP-binding protein [Deltaproteobacteria bacterium]|uniref:AMP-binding protein n=1 Tax=Candidatus Zymogenus saltonus TaxID=2844893 RepID=A0A9D8PPK6_9DELT|nr:AMP-binding protein [Candidatus Zymogenus saltonus]
MNVKKQLNKMAGRLPDKTALIYGDRRITFKQLKDRAFKLSSQITASGIKKGDKVFVYLPNIPEFVEIYLAATSIGVICVPIDFRTSGDELKSIIIDSDAKMIFTTVDMLKAIKAAGDNYPSVEKIVLIGDGEKAPDIDYEKFLSGGDPKEPDAETSEEDEALYLYTSGSTGRPRGVILQYRHLDLFPNTLHEIIPEYNTENTVMAVILPMSHITGPILVNNQLIFGNSLVIFESWRPDTVWKTVEREKVELFNSVPPIMQMMLADPKLESYDLSSLKYVSMMGMSVPKKLMEEYRRRIPHLKVIQGYGLTETSPLLTLLPLKYADEKMGSIGKVVGGVKMKFVDEDGNEVKQGELGEIVVSGPQVMKGYYKQPEETAKCIKDGWFHTGDLGRIDEDGFVYHLGRSSEIVITGGLNVFPAEVENILLGHENIMEASVLGIQDEKRGEVLAAVVVKRPGIDLTDKEVMKHCRERIADYKVPKMVKFIDALPLVGPGKVDKKTLTESFA